MDFLKAVLLAILIHFIAPVAVKWCENHMAHSAHEAPLLKGDPGQSGENR